MVGDESIRDMKSFVYSGGIIVDTQGVSDCDVRSRIGKTREASTS